MPTDARPVIACAASTLVAPALAVGHPWHEVMRTRVSAHYETGLTRLPIVSVGTPEAERMPYGVVVSTLPPWPIDVSRLSVRRWWRPDRPIGLAIPSRDRWLPWLDRPFVELDPATLVGRGIGLTPDGDDVLAAALVTAAAVDDVRLPQWRAQTRAALRHRSTTAVSAGMLHSALDGWAAPPLAGAVRVLCGSGDPLPAVQRLLRVGHSSGRALLDGVLHVMSTHRVIDQRAGAA